MPHASKPPAVLAEQRRLDDNRARLANWKRWGPYLSDRQWGTVREDYSPEGAAWTHFSHEQARSRAYRWGEDGLLGLCDRQCRLCFALALWNGRDPILKERLFGLTGPEGNHAEDVKEAYFFLDSTPTHAYLRALYKYPQAEFPYERLLRESRARGRADAEFELADTGAFNDDRYFDVLVEYAKASPDDLLARFTITNRGPETARIDLLPTAWFRNTWSWGCTHEGCTIKPAMWLADKGVVACDHPTLGRGHIAFERSFREMLFCDNETNFPRVFGVEGPTPYPKDAFHDRVVSDRAEAVNPAHRGTKAAAWYRLDLRPGEARTLRARLFPGGLPEDPLGGAFDAIVADRRAECDAYHDAQLPADATPEERRVARQAAAGLLWSKRFYHYVVDDWLKGDPEQPPPPASRLSGRNADWKHLFARDVLLMPDPWEYPWFAAWDLAFHAVAAARLDPDLAKEQLLLLLREWYMHPSGQIPAYEFAFGDVNPPVHAWACWRVYKMTGEPGRRDTLFLARCFHKLLINFTWWVNRKDPDGRHLFSGGFLGLDNIGVFDRSRPLPTGGRLEQADATAWMAFFCGTMLSIALELARSDPAYEDVASKFFEHFVSITDAINTLGGTGLWNEDDGFYYDQLLLAGECVHLRLRSLVGLVPLLAVEVIDERLLDSLPGFSKRMRWFLENRMDLARHISYMEPESTHAHRLLAIPSRERLARVLRYVLDEREFLGPYGVRSLSRAYAREPYVFRYDSREYTVAYEPGDSASDIFGGNSNWRGPVWFPTNFLLVEALDRYAFFYGTSFKVECPVGSGTMRTLAEVAQFLRRRLAGLFLPDEHGRRPCHGDDPRFARDPHWKDLILFHEFFHADSGRGHGASHQTGWTALVLPILRDIARGREAR